MKSTHHLDKFSFKISLIKPSYYLQPPKLKLSIYYFLNNIKLLNTFYKFKSLIFPSVFTKAILSKLFSNTKSILASELTSSSDYGSTKKFLFLTTFHYYFYKNILTQVLAVKLSIIFIPEIYSMKLLTFIKWDNRLPSSSSTSKKTSILDFGYSCFKIIVFSTYFICITSVFTLL